MYHLAESSGNTPYLKTVVALSIASLKKRIISLVVLRTTSSEALQMTKLAIVYTASSVVGSGRSKHASF